MDELLQVAFSLLFLLGFCLLLCTCLVGSFSVYKKVSDPDVAAENANRLGRL
uniref:p6 n=1 Tax=Olivavirus actinidiae TaxID=2024724 RepID=A0A7L9CEG8_9CLOS|nr:putative transmembrane protein [Actinidia virus 1]QOJ38384.1 P6 [Actinidia virus 1]QOJ38402.1 p6 [Actinidia virus 1]QOJ38426.1 P6 [Actinidia virus 1]UIW13996.1 MAG: putative transmembrane protein [Actinidia virus 1]